MRARLVSLSSYRVHDVTSGETVVGRDRACDVNPERKRRLARSELRVSRKHARIRPTAEGAHEVEDLGSRYGTTVNGERCEDGRAVAIRDKDVVAFGGVWRYIYLRFAADNGGQADEGGLPEQMRDEMQCIVCNETYFQRSDHAAVRALVLRAVHRDVGDRRSGSRVSDVQG
jgi:hypothetical protein